MEYSNALSITDFCWRTGLITFSFLSFQRESPCHWDHRLVGVHYIIIIITAEVNDVNN